MTGRTYEADSLQSVFAVVIGVVLVAMGVGALVVGEVQGLILVSGGAATVFAYGFWEPHRVTLDDSGVVLHAVARRVHIPWDELESVAPSPWDIRRQTLRWKRRRGLPVLTPNAFPDLHRILVEVERRAPKARVSS